MGAPDLGKITDTARGLIQNLLKARPNLELPPHLAKLQATHGVYVGDGRAEREILLGFQPTFVVFVIPTFPDGLPRPSSGGYWRPELHEQPVITEKGFKATKTFNKAGDTHVFVAWKSA